MMTRMYYCPHCDVEVSENELEESCCPYCNTEIPEAARRESGYEEEELGQ